MKNLFPVVALAVLLLMSLPAPAGTLRIGQPSVQGDQVTVPVLLEGEVADGVAAISFQLNYDPDVVKPQQATAGAAAQSAGKEIMVNVKQPGTYMVVMAGLNSNTVASGEVTNIVLERLGENASTNISITGTTFASLQGDEIPSRGSTGSISFEDQQQEPEETENNDEETPAAEEETPGQDNAGEDDKTSDPISIDVPDTGAPARRTPDMAPSGQADAPGSPAVIPNRPSAPNAEADAEESRRLAEALTAAASSRSSIGTRPAETQDAAQEKESEKETAADETQPAETQVAAITEGTEPASTGSAGTPASDAAVSAPAGTVAPGETTASAVQEGPASATDTAMPRDDMPESESNTTRTLIFLVIVVAVVAGIVLLRRRLFA